MLPPCEILSGAFYLQLFKQGSASSRRNFTRTCPYKTVVWKVAKPITVSPPIAKRLHALQLPFTSFQDSGTEFLPHVKLCSGFAAETSYPISVCL